MSDKFGKKRAMIVSSILAIVASVTLSFTASNNKITIYHQKGNGEWQTLTIGEGARAGHAAHGDLWFPGGCPLSGEPEACN